MTPEFHSVCHHCGRRWFHQKGRYICARRCWDPPVLLGLPCWWRERRARDDWADDDSMSAEETLTRFRSLRPDGLGGRIEE